MRTHVMRPGELEAQLQARLARAKATRATEGPAPQTPSARRRGKPWAKALLGGGLLTVLVVGSVALGLVNDSADCEIEVADRSGYDICTTDEGATAEYLGDSNTTFGSAGTGTFNSFVRVQASPDEQGYNTDGTLEFDTKSGTWTHSILVSEIPVVSVGGQLYWELFADINDGNNTPLISLNDVEVWFTDDPELTGYPFAAADAELIYDFDGEIRINDVNQGSGRGDLRFRIPLTGITIPDDCDYANTDCEVYFVLYNQWGTTGGAYISDGGFEEWKVKQYPTLRIVKNAVGGDGTFTYTVTGPSTPLVPAPSIATAGGTGSTITYIVDPGTYTIDEDEPPAGWSFTGAVCSIDGDPATPYTEGADLVLEETTHVVCVFTNTKDAHIIVDKVTNPAADPQSFSFDASGGSYADFSLTDTAAPNDQTLAPGTYGVAETVPAGWTLTSTVCNSSLGGTENAATIGLTAGETVTCTFTNTKQVAEGCTPGFWKNHLDAWAPTGFAPGDTLESVFDVPDSFGLDEKTLLQALGFEGGNTTKGAAKILLRAAVAAILNASHPDVDYEFALADIIADVNAALAGSRSDMLALAADLDAANNAGCPIGTDVVTVTSQVAFPLPALALTAGIAALRGRRAGRSARA